jgi:hypothetical protein
MQTSGLMHLHDNVHLHMTVCTQTVVEHFNWELFGQPPYGPELALSDYHLFIYLKS